MPAGVHFGFVLSHLPYLRLFTRIAVDRIQNANTAPDLLTIK